VAGESQHESDPIPELCRVLHGVYRLDLADGTIRLRIGPLPDHLIAAGAIEDGHVWLFIDREKPGAMGHARELLAAHPELIARHPNGAARITRGALTADPLDAVVVSIRR
jgi:hypothetical protein